MRQESNHRTSSGKDNRNAISNSRAMGVIILIALLFVFQVTTFVLHKVRVVALEKSERDAVGSSGSSWGGDAEEGGVSQSGRGMVAGERFPFDPNRVSLDSLQRLGFSLRQAQSVLNYRGKGGKFRYREDFAKLYVVDSAMYHSLAPFIQLPERYSVSAVERYALPAGGELQKSAVAAAKSADEEESVQKSTNSSTKLATGGKIVQESDKFSTKLADGGKMVGKATDSVGYDGKRGWKRGRDSLYGHKVVKNRYMCNLNTADSAALVQLYGIGGYYAGKILNYRERLGGSFVSPRQLLEIEGFTRERYAQIEKFIFIKEEDIKGFSILGADKKTLERHPYIGPYAARGILVYLRLKGGAASLLAASADSSTVSEAFSKQADAERDFLKKLVEERILTPENGRKLEEYLLHL